MSEQRREKLALDERLRALRLDFDRTFAAPPVLAEDALDYLAIRVAGKPYAVALAEVAGLHVDREILSLPSGAHALLGVINFRSELSAVFALDRLLELTSVRATPRVSMLAQRGRVG